MEASVFQGAAEPCLEAAWAFQAADLLVGPFLEIQEDQAESTHPSDDPAEVDCTRLIRAAREVVVPSLEIQEVLGVRAFHPEDQAAQEHASVDRASLVDAYLEVQAEQDLASLGQEDREDRPYRREALALVDSAQTASTLRS